jgi:hypothetical protein
MTSPPPTVIVDGMKYHATAMAQPMGLLKEFSQRFSMIKLRVDLSEERKNT